MEKSKKVKIHYIDFDHSDDAMKNINYPNSGLFIVRVKKAGSDLRFVNKSVELNYFIAPESVFNAVVDVEDIGLPIEEIIEYKYDGDFILEFARILLNSK